MSGSRRKRTRELGLPYSASADEMWQRFASPMTGFVCAGCGWIYIQAGKSGRKACPKCREQGLRRYACESLGDLSGVLISCETGHEDPIGNEVLIRRRFAEAYERFMGRTNDWKTAEILAENIAGAPPSRALVAKVYRDLKSKKPKDRKWAADWAPPSKPTLESLDAERREAERAKVRAMKKGVVRKKWL